MEWGLKETIGATGTAIGTGANNTNIIIAAQGATSINYAAGLARSYNGGGFNNWFLPSIDELNQMYVNRVSINGTATVNGGAIFSSRYYSSTERDSENAWAQDFGNGIQQEYNRKYLKLYVRAIRAF